MTPTQNDSENQPFEEPLGDPEAPEGTDAGEARSADGVEDGDIHAALHRKFRALVWLLGRDRAARRAEHGPLGDPSRGQGRVLAALKMQSPIATKDLAFLLGIRQQSLNELLGRLQGAGLIERAPSHEDRRVMLVHLTDAGRETSIEAGAASPFTVLDEDEAARLAELLDKVIAPLSQRLGEQGVSEEELESMRERLGEERFADVMRMREHGFGHGFGGFDGFGHGFPGPHGGPGEHGHGRGHGHGHGRGHGGCGGPDGQSGHRGHGGHGHGDCHGHGPHDEPGGPHRHHRGIRRGRAY